MVAMDKPERLELLRQKLKHRATMAKAKSALIPIDSDLRGLLATSRIADRSKAELTVDGKRVIYLVGGGTARTINATNLRLLEAIHGPKMFEGFVTVKENKPQMRASGDAGDIVDMATDMEAASAVVDLDRKETVSA